MDIDGAETRSVPHQFREHAKGHNGVDIRVPCVEQCQEILRPEAFGLCHRQSQCFSRGLDRRNRHALTTSSRFVWGGHNTHHFMRTLMQGAQARFGEIRRTKKGHT